MKMYKISLHSHTSDFSHFLFWTVNKKDYFLKLLEILKKKKGNLVLGITNFNNDKRYENLLTIARGFKGKFYLDDKYSNFYFILKIKGKEIIFVKTDEIETSEGHTLIVGFKGDINQREFHGVLKEAHKQNCLIFANHPLHIFGISYILVKKLLGGAKEISLSKKELIHDKKNIDALELNSYFPEDWKKIKEFAKKNKLPVVSDDDAHFIDEIFTSWYEVDNLDFSNPKNFKISLKKELKNGIKLHAHKFGHLALYKHAFQVVFESLGKKLGIIK